MVVGGPTFFTFMSPLRHDPKLPTHLMLPFVGGVPNVASTCLCLGTYLCLGTSVDEKRHAGGPNHLNLKLG